MAIITENTTLEILRIQGIKSYNNANYVYQHSTPYYHTNNQCPRLNSNYINILIPEKIRRLGDLEIKRYRNFFPEQSSSDSDTEKIKKVQIGANAVRAHYLSRDIILDESEIFEIVKRNHTDSININEVIDLDKKIQEYKNFLNSIQSSNDPQIKNIFNARYINNKTILFLYKNKSDKEKIMAKQLYQHKKEILSSAINQLMIIYEFNENNLNQEMLDKLGFKFCSHCSSQEIKKFF